MYPRTVGATDDVNNITTPGFYLCNGDAANLPTAASYMMQVYYNNPRVVQIAIRRTDNAAFQRLYYNSWSSWIRIYDDTILTDSTVLNPLASALGVQDVRSNSIWIENSSAGGKIVSSAGRAVGFVATRYSVYFVFAIASASALHPTSYKFKLYGEDMTFYHKVSNTKMDLYVVPATKNTDTTVYWFWNNGDFVAPSVVASLPSDCVQWT